MGLIPAHAGKTSRFSAYPTNPAGSSPRMRGKPNRGVDGMDCAGLIPAHAGKTTLQVRSSPCVPAHPRACGENFNWSSLGITFSGSSPRMRGKRAGIHRERETRGLIPAHAGKTGPDNLRAATGWAHPRACGENGYEDHRAKARRGSSPRMRGKRVLLGEGSDGVRLIPAHAGKTFLRVSSLARWRAHPRACGENGWCLHLRCGVIGSSPRMRGKPGFSHRILRERGLIPAHAGKTRS